jgi:hypothetical protein
MLARRLLLLAAVLMLLTALATGVASQPETVAPPPSPHSGRTVETVQGRLSAQEDDQSVIARVGDLVQLQVSGDVLDTVQIERLDRLDALDPSTPARFEVIAEEAGVYPVRLVEADRRIGQLDIRP